jgi:hypothetical protein
MSERLKVEFQEEKDAFEALSIIKAVGDVLTIVGQTNAPEMLGGSLLSLGNLLVNKADELGKSLGVEL